MAFRAAAAKWRSMLTRMEQNRAFASSTPPKFAGSATAAQSAAYNKFAPTGEFAPVMVVLGMVVIAAGMAVHTVKQQLIHCPSVSISKKRRGTILEVDDPDKAVNNSDKFLNKSFLRKVGNIQKGAETLPDPGRPANPYRRRDPESLKAVGVNPGSRS